MYKYKATRNTLLFLIPSLLGIFFFMTPVLFQGEWNIPIATLKDLLLNSLGSSIYPILIVIMGLSLLLTIITRLFKPKFILKEHFLKTLFDINIGWTIVRTLGVVFSFFVYFEIGPEMITNGETGAFVFNDLLPTLFAVFIFAGFLLPLLTHFGLLELFGTLLTKIMRPLFNLPGRSAIDCFASWLGDGSVGILMSNKQYEDKNYTQREASVIGTTFSAVSISFCLVVISQLQLDHMFIPFYGVVCITGIVVAIVVSRIPPLSRKKDVMIDGTERAKDAEMIPEDKNVLEYGYENALHTVDKIDRPSLIIKEGFKNAIDMIIGILPAVMAVGSCGLIIATYTPLFEWLGYPFVPLLKLLQIPMAVEASQTMVVGFADMFIPSILASSFENEMTRFVVGAVSVTQLIFMSEVGALILGSKIPVNFFELFVIFIQRTVVSLPIIALFAHLLF